MNAVIDALSLLTPFDVDSPKVRVGPPEDGGYVMIDRLSPEQTVMSYGISTEYRFDRALAENGHKVLMFDHTIDGISDPHPNMVWFREGVAGVSQPSNGLYSIADHITNHKITGDRLILKLDVEGAEFDAIGHASDFVLSLFEQIVIEVHSLYNIKLDHYRSKLEFILNKLNSQFVLHHVHANNYDGPDELSIICGVPVVNIIELSYIKRSVVRSSFSKTLYPTKYDYPNVTGRDKLLWFYPFLPTVCSQYEFDQCVGNSEFR